MAIPLIELLKEKFPGAGIDILLRPEARNLIETNPDLGEYIVFDKHKTHRGFGGLRTMIRRLADKKYDLCITPHRSWRSAYLTLKTKAPKRIGFDRSAWKGAYTDIVPYYQSDHEIERNLSLLKPLAIHSRIRRPKIYPSAEDKQYAESCLNFTGNKMVALAPGSIWPTKRWPASYFSELAGLLNEKGYYVVLIGGKDDYPLCEFISDNGRQGQNLAGYLSLRQTCHILTLCSCLVTNDSAPLHLGTAAGIPVIAIFGPTVPEFGFSPIGTVDGVIELKGLQCRPCGMHGHRKCPVKTFACMEQVTPGMVWQEIQQRIN